MTDLERTRKILAEVAGMHDARGVALEASGLTDWHARCQWLADHPVTEWFRPTALEVLDHELTSARAEGVRFTYASRSVPQVRKRRVPPARFTANQLRIADEVLARKHIA
jgi:hypothetical protein